MLDPFFLIPFACLSIIMIPNRTRVLPAVFRACGTVFCIVSVALIALNLPWEGTLLLPEWPVALDAIFLSIASAVGAAAASALFLSRLKPATSKWIVRAFVFTGLLAWRFTPVLASNAIIEKVMDWGLSTTALSVGAVLVLLDIALLRLLSRTAVQQS
jgi:hypothetical protein